MSKHSSIFSVSIPTREQQTDADKMAFPQPRRGAGEGVREREGNGSEREGYIGGMGRMQDRNTSPSEKETYQKILL